MGFGKYMGFGGRPATCKDTVGREAIRRAIGRMFETLEDRRLMSSTAPDFIPATLTITPANPNTNQVLTANAQANDIDDGDDVTYEYQWLKGGTDIAGATGRTLNLAAVGNGDKG